MEFDIRWAKQDDQEWADIMNMIWNTFLHFDGQDCTKEGRQNFYEFLTDPSLHQSFEAGKYQVLVALDEGKVVGVASLRNINHLSLLFVDEEYQMMGIGRSLMKTLFDYLLLEIGAKSISVTATPYAVGFYKKLGFEQIAPEKDYSGVHMIAMEKVFGG